MTPNNNFSVLPFYKSKDDQDFRRWWKYGRIYPLYCRAGYLLPFQVSRPTLTQHIYTPGAYLTESDDYSDKIMAIYFATSANVVQLYDGEDGDEVLKFDVSAYAGQKLYVQYLPPAYHGYGSAAANLAFVDAVNKVISYDEYGGDSGYTGAITIPATAKWLYIQAVNIGYSSNIASVREVTESIVTTPINLFEIYKADGTLVGDYTAAVSFYIKTIGDNDIIIHTGAAQFAAGFAEGQYYAKMSDGENVWYSDVFTAVADISRFIKLEWWDNEDFVMDAGRIVYKPTELVTYHNIAYLKAEIAKPEYTFEEEVEKRDGMDFPTKQISSKTYRFSFMATEYLLDALRFVRMADHIVITDGEKVYRPSAFLITPEWEKEGDVAGVDAQFQTDTIAKKIGLAYVRPFNNDFNNDFS